jgi:hypothetical protein
MYIHHINFDNIRYMGWDISFVWYLITRFSAVRTKFFKKYKKNMQYKKIYLMYFFIIGKSFYN